MLPSDREIGMLVGLADGSLTEAERAAAERELLSSPEYAAALELQVRAVQAVRRAAPTAPVALREGIDSQLTPKRRRPAIPALRPALAAGAAVVLALVVLAVARGPDGDPTIAEAAELGLRPIAAPAPARDPAQPTLLRKEAAGVRFPSWEREFGWLTQGARTDQLGGRRAETVFYTHEGHHIAYTIVAGAPLEPPQDARQLVVRGVRLHVYRDGVRDVVTFERGGRTCVLAGHVMRQSTLVKLAAWKGQGSVSF